MYDGPRSIYFLESYFSTCLTGHGEEPPPMKKSEFRKSRSMTMLNESKVDIAEDL